MKKVMAEIKRALSVLLAVAMIVTMVSESSITTYAAELDPEQTVQDEISDTEANVDEETASEDENVDKTATSEDENVDETAASEDENVDEAASEDENADETAVSEEGNAEETVSVEETEIPNKTVMEAAGEEATSYTVKIAEGSQDHATIEFTNGCVADGKIAAGVDLTFKVTPAEGYRIAETGVTYAVSDETAVIGGEDKDTYTEYTIDATSIENIFNDKEDTTELIIKVETEVIQYNVRFSILEGATVKDAEGNEIADEAEVIVDYNSSVSFSVEVDPAYKLSSVSWSSETNAEVGSVLEGTGNEGAYNFSFKPSEDVVIGVITEVKATYIAAFDYNSEQVTVYQPVSEGDNTTLKKVENDAFSFTEGDNVAFVVEPTTGYKVTAVKVNGETCPSETLTYNDKEYTQYVIENATSDFTAIIASEIDRDQAHILHLDVEGNASAVRVMPSVSADEKLENGEEYLTLNDSTELQVFVDGAYEAEVALFVGDEERNDVLQPQDDGQYTVSGNSAFTLTFASEENETDIHEATLKITVEGKESSISENSIFTFNNVAEHMSYNVQVNDNVSKAAGKNNTYEIKPGTKNVAFTVTASGNYVPVVYAGGQEVSGTAAQSKTVKGVKQTKYSYTVSAAIFDDQDGRGTIRIEETAETKILTINYDASEVTVSAKLAGKEYQSNSESDNAKEYIVNTDSSLVLVVTPLENCKITGATTQIGTAAAKKASTKATGAEITVKVTNDAVVNVSSEGLYTTQLYEATSHELLAATKNVYTVAYDGTYIAQATYGADTHVEISEVAFGGKNVKTTAEITDNADAKITVNEADAGKSITVKLYSGTGDNKKVVGSYTLKVSSVLTGITVKGVKNGSLTQTVDTTVEYALTAAPKTADLSKVTAKVTNATEVVNVEAKVNDDGKLVVTTPAAKEGSNGAATIQLYNGDNTIGNPITVNTALPAWVNKTAPTVKAKSTDDVSVTLTVTAPKNTVEPVTGNQYYKVVATPKTGAPENVNVGTVVTEYFPKEGASQDVTITVNKNIAVGQGTKWKYDLEVTLVQTDGTEAGIAADTIAEKTQFASKSKKVTAETKNPAYETKLTLKKGTTTLYRGQENVKVATAQFSKNTTYKKLKAIDPIKVWSDDDNDRIEAITFETADDGSIYATVVDADLEPGKYSCTVRAESRPDTLPASATLTITIASGISSIDVTTPSNTIYKADKKAATLKVTPVFNAYSYATKAKKVNYEIVDVHGDALAEDSRLNGMVTVKNGTVTVNKNYVVAADQAENTFCVKVTAADYKGNPAEGISEPITITASAQTLGEVCIVKYDSEKDGYIVVTKGNTTLTSEDLDGAGIAVIAKGIEEKDVYTEDDFVDTTYLSYKSSNKALVIWNDGGVLANIHANKTAKNVKITVSTNDGGKQSVVLDKLTIGYMGVEALGIWAEQYTSNGNYIANLSEKKENEGSAYTADAVVHFSGTTDSVLSLRLGVLDEEGKWIADVSGNIIDYKLSVSGGKVLSNRNGYATILVNTKSAVVTLKYNGKGDKFTFVNDTFADAKAPTVKASGSILSDRDAAQTVTYKLSGNYTAKYVKVEVDPSVYYGSKTWWAAFEIEEACSAINNTVAIKEDGTFDLTFAEDSYIEPGSYKLQLTFGDMVDFSDEDGENKVVSFVPGTKAVTTTLKVTKSKVNGSYKPVSKVTFLAKDQSSVELKGTGKNIIEEDYYGLFNVNVNGQPNNFTKYFELDSATNTLKIKEGVDVTSISKADLTGYVSYGAKYGENTYWWPTFGNAKITVTLKNAAAGKLSSSVSSNTIIVNEGSNKASMTVLANGKPTAVEDVVSHWSSRNMSIIDHEYDGSNVTFTLSNTKAGSYSVNLYIVPVSSPYYSYVKSTRGNSNAWFAAVKKYGMPLNITIKVKEDIPDATSGEDTTTVALTDCNIALSASDGSYTVTAGENGIYTVEIAESAISSGVCPDVSVSYDGTALTKDTDFTYVYANNTVVTDTTAENVNYATVTVSAIEGSSYTGSAEIKFIIKASDMQAGGSDTDSDTNGGSDDTSSDNG